MIPKNVRDGAVAQGLTGETRQFTIAYTREAFRTLIDGLYSNKVRAVIRELCSNAADSHIAAKQARPFQVQIPTNLDPTFRVRDFGTSLDHDDVMGLYTTLFQSSKRDTNEQTGMLGLGSKSPFAFVDSFSVMAYKDGMRRVYLAFLDQSGVPALNYVGAQASNEPQGLEVSFAVDRQHMSEFQREMQYVAMGYKQLPEVIGMSVKVPKPRLSGATWAIYPVDEFRDIGDRRAYVRQGSALYPSDITIPNTTSGFITVIDIPIGTAEVAASREMLSYTEATRQQIRRLADNAYTEIRAHIDAEVAKAITRVQKATVSQNYIGILNNMRGFGVEVPIQADPDKITGRIERIPGDVLERAGYFGKATNGRRAQYNRYASSFPVHNISSLTIFVNERDVKVVRRHKRVLDCGLPNAWVLDVEPTETKAAIDWVTQCLELQPHQFKLISTLPDHPPVKKAYQKSAKRTLAPNQFWMIRDNGCVVSEFYGHGDHIRARYSKFWPTAMEQAATFSKNSALLNTADTFWVTTAQADRWLTNGTLDPARKLDRVIYEAVQKLVDPVKLDTAQTYRLLVENVGRHNRALPVVIRNFYPTLSTMSDAESQQMLEQAVLAKISLATRPIVAKISAEIKILADAYPLLFNRSDEKVFEHYVKAVKMAAQNP